MSKQQRGLGKGLGALLGGDTDLSNIRKPVGYVNKEVVSHNQQPKQATADVLRIPVDMIEPNPFQPRMNFDKEALEELSDSIRTLGLIQPITVRKKDEGRYQIISGERRFRACQIAGMDMIPAYIRDTNDQGMLEMAIVENIQRENLDPIETAMSYQRLIDECNLTQEQMAFRVGKKMLKQVGLFDVYRGDKIAEGKKQYALSFVLQDLDKTLTDNDVERVMSKLLSTFQNEFGAVLR